MIELLILWNVAAARADASEDSDFSSGAIAVWIMLQILIWPISMFALLWKKVGMRWDRALIVSGIVMTWGLWLGGENFFFSMGMIFIVLAGILVGKEFS
jgi:hypothetical protein